MRRIIRLETLCLSSADESAGSLLDEITHLVMLMKSHPVRIPYRLMRSMSRNAGFPVAQADRAQSTGNPYLSHCLADSGNLASSEVRKFLLSHLRRVQINTIHVCNIAYVLMRVRCFNQPIPPVQHAAHSFFKSHSIAMDSEAYSVLPIFIPPLLYLLGDIVTGYRSARWAELEVCGADGIEVCVLMQFAARFFNK